MSENEKVRAAKGCPSRSANHAPFVTLLLTLFAAQRAQPQATVGESLPRWALTLYAGAAPQSTISYWRFDQEHGPHRNQYLLGIHGVAPVMRAGWLALAYAPEIIPAYVLSNPADHSSGGRALGFAVAPVGLELSMGSRAWPWRLFGNGELGLAWFNKEVPAPDARAFNYMIDYGGGLSVALSGPLGVRAGWKYHHLSNDYTAERNPGIDGHMYYLGLQYDFARVRR